MGCLWPNLLDNGPICKLNRKRSPTMGGETSTCQLVSVPTAILLCVTHLKGLKQHTRILFHSLKGRGGQPGHRKVISQDGKCSLATPRVTLFHQEEEIKEYRIFAKIYQSVPNLFGKIYRLQGNFNITCRHFSKKYISNSKMSRKLNISFLQSQ